MTPSASALAADVAQGRRSAQEVVEEALDRLEQAQDSYNACTLIDRSGASARAREIDEMLAAGQKPGPLVGVPMAVKDLIDQAGLPTTCGSGFYRKVPERSAPVIDRLEAAGAVMVARTGLHEFAYGFSSENPWFGPVRNPWDPTTSPGGSSGGSAVAVAAELVPLALGTDTGGSVRVPAALTGTFGLKVTHGRIPTTGVFPLAPSLDTVGPIARTTSDLALAYRIMAGVGRPDHAPGWSGMRVGLPRAWLAGTTKPPVPEAFAASVVQLTDLGATIVDLDLPDLVPWGMIQELAGAEAAHVHRDFLARGEPYGEDVSQRLAGAARVTPDQYLEAHAWRTRLVETFAAAFVAVDIIATPAVAAVRKVIGEERIDGDHYRPVLSWFSALVNHAGAPALAMPLFGSGSPPVSLQLIAPWWQEERLLALAAAAEHSGLVGFQTPESVMR